MAFLGIDTSNYTTSVALCDKGRIIKDARRLLSVKEGELGLRQSDALFQHWHNMPELIEEALYDFEGNVDGIVVSVKPRPQEGSYMPCFTAGQNAAKMLGSALGVPVYGFSHQEGHILSAAYENDVDFKKPVICVHISGGTLEIVRVAGGSIEIVGKTRDISYGQLLDRTGQMMGFDFPSGKYIDECAMNYLAGGSDDSSTDKGSSTAKQKNPLPKIFAEGSEVNISGIETAVHRIINEYSNEALSYFVLERISESLVKIIDAVRTDETVLIGGGVASSRFIQSYCKDKNYRFAKEGLGSDNAVGLALSEGERPWQ